MKSKQEILNLVENLPPELKEKFQQNLQMNQSAMQKQDSEAKRMQEQLTNQTQSENQMNPMKSGNSLTIAERFKNLFSRKKKK
jgi:hypothetical protein